MLRLTRTTRSSVLLAFLIALAAPVRAASDFLSLGISWTAHLDSPLVAAPAIDADRVYLPLRSGKLRALAVEDGKETWAADVGTVVGLAIDAAIVVALTDSGLVGLDPQAGHRLWNVPLAGAGAPPSARGGWVLVGAEQDLLAFRASDGHLVWRLALGAAVRSRVTIDGDRVYAPLDDGSLAAVDITRGHAIWRERLPAPPGAVTSAGDTLYVGCTDNFFYALDAENGDRHWRWRVSAAVLPPAAYDEARVYYTALDNVVRAVDAGSGVQKWRSAMETRPLGGPTLDDDLLILAGGTELQAIRVADGTRAGKWPAPAELVSAPVFVPTGTEPASTDSVATPTSRAGRTRAVIITGATTGDWRVYGLARLLEPAPQPLTETPGRPLSPDVPTLPPGPPPPAVPPLP